MEILKKVRCSKRTTFTRTHTQLTAAIADAQASPYDIRALYNVLESKFVELNAHNDRVLEAMEVVEATTEDEIVAEMTSCDEYKLRFHQLKQRVMDIINPAPPPPALNMQPEALNATHMNVSMAENCRYRFPTMEIPKFNGELKGWLPFWSRFKNIHESETLKDEEKFHFLIQAMEKGSRASNVLASFPPTAENYPKAVESLEKRFGKKEMLVEVYVRELLCLVLQSTSSGGENLSITNIYDKLETHLRALETLDVTTEMCAAMLYPLVESALPVDVLRAWQRHPTSTGVTEAKKRLQTLMEFLQGEVEAEQRIQMAAGGFGMNKTKEKHTKDTKEIEKKPSADNKRVSTAAGLLAAKGTGECIFCDESHESPDCEKARRMTLAERTKVAQEKGACFYCLKLGHGCKTCRYKQRCGWCSKRHVILMCRQVVEPAVAPRPAGSDAQKTPEQSLANLSTGPEVFLQTLRVKLVNNGKEKIVRAVIDHGSHRSYILTQDAEDMGFCVEGKRTMTHLLFGGTQTRPVEHKVCKVRVRSLDGTYTCNFQAYHQDVICQNVEAVSKGPWLTELNQKSIHLSDIGSSNESISLLIGADIVGKLYTGELHNLECGATAINTQLGWTLIGKHDQLSTRPDPTLLTVSMFARDASVQQLWKLDVIGITDPIEQKSKEALQQDVLNRFRDTILRDSSNRYEVKLPWKENSPALVNNRGAAERRLTGTLKKLEADKLTQDYENVFDEWLAEGIIEEVPQDQLGNTAYYLPHRHVVKEGSTTRVRPVFDASAKDKNGVSLNQCLEPGPNLIELIPTLLYRFREQRVGIISDIKKAFLQISVADQDRDVLRFLWKRTTNPDTIIELRHKRVVFGVSSSPFLLGATIELHLEQLIQRAKSDEERFMLIKLKNSFYVDNCVTSVGSLEQANQFKTVSISAMAEGGFDLRGWEYTGDTRESRMSPVLGMTWDKETDTLQLAEAFLDPQANLQITKRIMLSVTQKIFDPLGMACPTLLVPKLTLQKL